MVRKLDFCIFVISINNCERQGRAKVSFSYGFLLEHENFTINRFKCSVMHYYGLLNAFR